MIKAGKELGPLITKMVLSFIMEVGLKTNIMVSVLTTYLKTKLTTEILERVSTMEKESFTKFTIQIRKI